MNIHIRRRIRAQALAMILASFALELSAALLSLETTPLFTINAVKSNLILSIDDSGSMDSEVLFESNDGALWWDTTNHTFVSGGAVNFNILGNANSSWKKFVYLFPNGTGTGKRVYSDSTNDHYAIPPLPQYDFLRSSAYNKMYYDPNVTYDTWADYGLATYGNINPASAPADPVTGTGVTVNLTQNIQSDVSNNTFRLFTGTRVPAGTVYSNAGTSNWLTLGANYTVPNTSPFYKNWGLIYFPATYYIKVTSGTYTINGSSGNCLLPNISDYTTFEQFPWTLSGIDALGPDGACLSKVEIKPATTSYAQNGGRTECGVDNTVSPPIPIPCSYSQEIQNFANWYSYYRKRHLALRAGMGLSFENIKALRTGLFKINNLTNVTMWDVDVSAQYNSFYQAMYNVAGNGGGTPNRAALDYAGQQFMRNGTGASAPIITQACQKNFTLHFTDGYSTLTNPATPPGNADGGKGNPYADSYSNTFADIAMKYYTTVLRGNLAAGQVPTAVGCNASPLDPQLDCNKDLHMNTFTVGLAGKGTIFGVTHNKVQDAYGSPPPVWPDTNTARDPRQIDDLYHAAVNGRGEMFNASSPQDLKVKLTDALLSIQSKSGSASAVTFNTATLEANSAVYLGFFNSGNWSGDLVSFDLDGQGNVNLTRSWSVANKLDNANPTPASRVILTRNGSAGVAFQWANLSGGQQSDLNLVPGGNGQAGLDFIRGDRSKEGTGTGKFRVRASVLGDIVHSSPVFVGKPNLTWPDTLPFPTVYPNRYLDFRTNLIQTPRKEVIYFGGNDGILHGVQSSDGREVLAYIPANLFSITANAGLHYLADPQYQHQYYVDLAPTISDVYITRNSTTAWRTILVGGERAGGRGLFALDITDPTQFSETNAANLVLWEFTNPDLGFTYSRPTIAMMENGRWAAVFGNGYNDTGTGQAKLFILFIDGGFDGVWTDGSGGTAVDYMILSTAVGSTTSPNGLATPAVVDIDGNGAADRVYAGDLKGNMWAFDLSSSTPSNWGSAYLNGTVPAPLFVAQDASNNLQPITSKLGVAFHPNPPNRNHTPNVLVFFGTGKYLEQSDLTLNSPATSSTLTQSFYGVLDEGTSNLTRTNLVQQTISTGSFTDSTMVSHTNLRKVSDTSINYSSKFGWVIDLNLILSPNPTERVVVDPILRGSIVFFNTWIPDPTPCSAGGTGFLMSVEQLNGGAPDNPAFNVNGDTIVDKNDLVTDSSGNSFSPAGEAYVNGLPAQSTFLSNKQYTPGTGSKVIEVRDVADLGGPGTGRLSWQQLTK